MDTSFLLKMKAHIEIFSSEPESKFSNEANLDILGFLLNSDIWGRLDLAVCCGRPWPAAYINFNQNIHQIQVLTKPLCRAQAIFYSLPNNEWGTKYHGLT